MKLLNSVRQSVQDRKLKQRLKMQRREAAFTIISIISAVLFVVGMVIGIINIIESIKKRFTKKKKEETPAFTIKRLSLLKKRTRPQRKAPNLTRLQKKKEQE